MNPLIYFNPKLIYEALTDKQIKGPGKLIIAGIIITVWVLTILTAFIVYRLI